MKTGPFTKQTDIRWSSCTSKRQLYETVTWWRSRPVRSEPLPYYKYQAKSLSTCVHADNTWAAYYCAAAYDSDLREKARARAYDRFKEGVWQEAQLAVNLAERRQAVTMIVQRATQIRRSFQLLRRGNWYGAVQNLGLDPNQLPSKKVSRKRWQRPKEVSSAWLELHFGWVPLIKDIHSAVEILQSPLPYTACKGRARSERSAAHLQGMYAWSTEVTYSYAWHYQAFVRVSNPNLWLANQLGLVNPAAIAWELIPFSFLVDWFIPVGDFLNSWTDFVGLTLEGAFTTEYRVFASTQTYKQPSGNMVEKGTSFLINRELGIAQPALRIKALEGLSVTRGATAIALLVTVFKQHLRS